MIVDSAKFHINCVPYASSSTSRSPLRASSLQRRFTRAAYCLSYRSEKTNSALQHSSISMNMNTWRLPAPPFKQSRAKDFFSPRLPHPSPLHKTGPLFFFHGAFLAPLKKLGPLIYIYMFSIQATVRKLWASPDLLVPPWTQLDTSLGFGKFEIIYLQNLPRYSESKLGHAIPGHLALLERVFLVLDGAAPSLSQLCGVCSYFGWNCLADRGRLFQDFLSLYCFRSYK